MGLINIGGENQGPPGPQGPQGPAGSAGANGTRGSTITLGADPEEVTGALAGDLFILDTNGLLYQYDGSQWVNTTIHVKGSRWYESGTEPLDLVPGDVLYDDVGFLQIYLGDAGFEGIGRISPAMWYFGEDTSEVSAPLKGDLFVVVSTGDVFQYDPETGWAGFPDTPLINIKGPQGAAGAAGAAGPGLAPGGTTGQIAAKASDDDYDVEWIDPPSGGVSPIEVLEIFDDHANPYLSGASIFASPAIGFLSISGSSGLKVPYTIDGAYGLWRIYTSSTSGTWTITGADKFYAVTRLGNYLPIGMKKTWKVRFRFYNKVLPNNDITLGWAITDNTSYFGTDLSTLLYYGIQCGGPNTPFIPALDRFYHRSKLPGNNFSEWIDLGPFDDQWHTFEVQLTYIGTGVDLAAYFDGALVHSASNRSLQTSYMYFQPLGAGRTGLGAFKGWDIDWNYFKIEKP